MCLSKLDNADVYAIKLVSKTMHRAFKKPDGQDLLPGCEPKSVEKMVAQSRLERKWHRSRLTTLYCRECDRVKPRGSFPDKARSRSKISRYCADCCFRTWSRHTGIVIDKIQTGQCTDCKALKPLEKLTYMRLLRRSLCKDCLPKMPPGILEQDKHFKKARADAAAEASPKYGMFGNRKRS